MDAILCGLETYPCPHTVLCQVAAQRSACASEVQARGEGQHTWIESAARRNSRAGADVQSQAKGSGLKSLYAPPRSLKCRRLPQSSCSDTIFLHQTAILSLR